PAGPKHPRQLLEAALEICEVADAETHGGRVEVAVRERERERVALDPFDGAGLLARALEHLRREVEADDPSAAALGLDRQVARAAARIEHAIARPDDLAHGELAPALVQPGRHHTVHDVVHRRDAIEHALHRRRLQCPRLVGHVSPQRFTSALSMPIWSRQRATTKSTRSSIVSAPW